MEEKGLKDRLDETEASEKKSRRGKDEEFTLKVLNHKTRRRGTVWK